MQEGAALFLLRFQVPLRKGRGVNLTRDSLDYADSGSLKCEYLIGIVGNQSNTTDTKGFQDFERHRIVAAICFEPEPFIRVDGVPSFVL